MMDFLTIQTPRLQLVAAKAALIHLELENRPKLFETLNVAPPADWPPPLNDEASFKYFLDTLERDPAFCGWGYWYVIEKPRELIGTGGFKGRLDAVGTTEIGYSIVPARQGTGFASEAAAALIEWCRTRGAKTVVAETLPKLAASIRVMEKNGLAFDGQGSEPGTIRDCRVLT
jgi:ribosomal-protein-alanine N-acetyltransferase